jgi:biopolymer transport protein ExbD/biopolymer transport protein TolR
MSATDHKWFLNTLKRKNALYCRIDVWGFVSVMLAILFLFMPTSPHTPPRVSVDLSASHHAVSMPKARREDAIRVSITSDGSLYFRDQRVADYEIPDLIREGVRNGAEKKVYISADARAKYGRVLQVLGGIQLAGVEKTCFITWQQ